MYNYELTDSLCVEILRILWKINISQDGKVAYKLENELNDYCVLIKNRNDTLLDKKAYLIMNYIMNNCNYFISNKTLTITITKKILVEYLNNSSIEQRRYFKACEQLTKYDICIFDKNKNEPKIISPIVYKIDKLQNGIAITMGRWFEILLLELQKNNNLKFKKGNIDYSLFLSGRTDRPKCIYSLKTIVYLARLNENKSFRNREYNIKKYIPELFLLDNKTRTIEMIERINKALLPMNIQIKINNKLTLEELKTKGVFQIEYAKGVS